LSTRELEAEIRDLAARRDIADVTHRYMRGLDRIDRELLLSAFHADAHVDCGVMEGDPNAFADFALGFLGDMNGTHHILGQVRIEMTGDHSARGECYFQAFHDISDEAGQARDLFIAGRYLDAYTCVNGEWRIARRTLITDWVSDQPGSRTFFADNPQAGRGQRNGNDFSQQGDWSTPASLKRTNS